MRTAAGPIDIGYVARVEGEADLRVDVEGGPAIELRVFEPPRFFEGFLVGRKFDEVGDIVSRICGICPVSHMTTAILAVERAMGIETTRQTAVLRELLTRSQIAASHLVHLYSLAMPDYYGAASVAGLLPGKADAVRRMIRMKTVLNDLTALIGGRALHPISQVPGGFTAVPGAGACARVRQRLLDIRDDAARVVDDVAALEVPALESESVRVGLAGGTDYPVNGGRIVSTSGLDVDVDRYPERFAESRVPYAYTKPSRIVGEERPFMVGALARINVKFETLREETRRLAEDHGITAGERNPFRNLVAQALEVHDSVLRCAGLLEGETFRDDPARAPIKAGEGGAATEAPRGLLYHWYAIDRRGVVEKANIVTPTSHNFLSLEGDLRTLVRANAGRPREELVMLCEKLIRAYDPCFSCSVH